MIKNGRRKRIDRRIETALRNPDPRIANSLEYIVWHHGRGFLFGLGRPTRQVSIQQFACYRTGKPGPEHQPRCRVEQRHHFADARADRDWTACFLGRDDRGSFVGPDRERD